MLAKKNELIHDATQKLECVNTLSDFNSQINTIYNALTLLEEAYTLDPSDQTLAKDINALYKKIDPSGRSSPWQKQQPLEQKQPQIKSRTNQKPGCRNTVHNMENTNSSITAFSDREHSVQMQPTPPIDTQSLSCLKQNNSQGNNHNNAVFALEHINKANSRNQHDQAFRWELFRKLYNQLMNGRVDIPQEEIEPLLQTDYNQFARYDNRPDISPKVSVVIVAYQTNKALLKCLDSLILQTEPFFEIIVVDNGNNEETVMELLCRPILYIKCPDNLILSFGRNVGSHFAHSEIIAFLDDDALVPTNYVGSIVTAFENYPIACMRGKVKPKTNHPNNYGKAAGHYDLGETPFPYYINTEGNSAWSRKIYLEFNGMNPLLFGAEGAELSYRIMQKYGKASIIYWPETIINHDFAPSDGKHKSKNERHQVMKRYLDTIDPDIRKYILKMESSLRNLNELKPGTPLISIPKVPEAIEIDLVAQQIKPTGNTESEDNNKTIKSRTAIPLLQKCKPGDHKPGERIIFAHVNKAGGTTLHRILEQSFPKNKTYDTNGKEWSTKRTKILIRDKSRHRYQLIKGHMGFGLHHYFNSPSTYITILREPVDRIISLYYHYRRRDTIDKHSQIIKKQNMSLYDFIKSDLTAQLDNWQTRMFAANTGFPIGFKDKYVLDINDFEKAKNNLTEYFSVVGLTEYFDETLFLINSKFNLNNYNYTKQNATKERPYRNNVPDKIQKVITERNKLDIELYSFARQLLFKELDKYNLNKNKSNPHQNQQALKDYSTNNIIMIDPASIIYCTLGDFDIREHRVSILDGNWDEKQKLFEENYFYKTYKQKLLHGIQWEETEYYKFNTAQINKGFSKWGCCNTDEFLQRCKKLDSIYKDMQHNGFKQSPGHNYITVNIGRNGDLFFNDGRHRLAFAKLLGLKEIPVKVSAIHKQYAYLNQIIIPPENKHTAGVYASL